jgi:hypothetical protein
MKASLLRTLIRLMEVSQWTCRRQELRQVCIAGRRAGPIRITFSFLDRDRRSG